MEVKTRTENSNKKQGSVKVRVAKKGKNPARSRHSKFSPSWVVVHSKDAPEGINANTRLAEAMVPFYNHQLLAVLFLPILCLYLSFGYNLRLRPQTTRGHDLCVRPPPRFSGCRLR